MSNYKTGDTNDSDILIEKRMMDMTCDDPTWLGTVTTDEKQRKTHTCDWSLSDEQEGEYSKTANKGKYQSIFFVQFRSFCLKSRTKTNKKEC